MVHSPKPKNIKQLREFLELTGYYRKFVKGYRMIAKPLTDLLRKDSFQWTTTSDLAFEQLKQAMSSTPVLALPDFQKDFTIETDACQRGIGIALMQDKKPLAYLSKAIGVRNMGMSIYEKELLALVTTVGKWRHYLRVIISLLELTINL